MDPRTEAIRRAIAEAGGPAALARRIGVTAQAIVQWTICPPLRVLDVERATGVSRSELRPDLYPPNDFVGSAPATSEAVA